MNGPIKIRGAYAHKQDFLTRSFFSCQFGPETYEGYVQQPAVPQSRNPNAHNLAVENRRWVVDMGICSADSKEMRGLELADFEELAAAIFNEESAEDLLTVTNLLTVVFMFDDMLDHEDSVFNLNVSCMSEACHIVLNMFSGENQIEDLSLPMHLRSLKFEAILRGFSDVFRRLASRFGEQKLLEVQVAMNRYMCGLIGECLERAVAKATDAELCLEDLRLVRVEASGIIPFLEVGAVMRRFSISEEVRSDPCFDELRSSVALAAAYVNDLFSAQKEAIAAEPINLVLMLQKTRGLSEHAAMHAACEVHDAELKNYIEHRDLLLARYEDAGLRDYIRLAESGLRNNFAWFSDMTDRYSSLSSTDMQWSCVVASEPSLAEPESLHA